MLTEEMKHDLETTILNSISSAIDELKELQEYGWQIDLDDPVEDLLDLQSSYSLRDSLLEEPGEMRKRGELPAQDDREEARAYIEEVLAGVESFSLRAFKERMDSGTPA